MKRLLLATAAMLAALTVPAVATEISRHDIIKFSGTAIACPGDISTIERLELELWLDARYKSDDPSALDQWIKANGCGTWKNREPLIVWKISQNHLSSRSVKLCVYSSFVFSSRSGGCIWMIVDKQNVKICDIAKDSSILC
jgi:hypothetical protein